MILNCSCLHLLSVGFQASTTIHVHLRIKPKEPCVLGKHSCQLRHTPPLEAVPFTVAAQVRILTLSWSFFWGTAHAGDQHSLSSRFSAQDSLLLQKSYDDAGAMSQVSIFRTVETNQT